MVAGVPAAKPREVELSSIEIRTDDVSSEPTCMQTDSHTAANGTDSHTGCSQSDEAQPESADGDDWRESETERLLDRRPLSDSPSRCGSDAGEEPSDTSDTAGEEPYTVSDTVWYRETPVLLALVASSLNGLYFSFLDEVCDLALPLSW